MAVVIAGERSGVGKTTVTLSLLAALQRQHSSIQSFKVGPDYIDPMFHQWITGRACRNLDVVLTSESYVLDCFYQHSQAADYALVEGVMGLFDGASVSDDWGSTAHVARLLNLPILLVLDCSRLSRSIAAIAHGYCTFDPRLQIAGLVLNRVGSDRHLDLLRSALEPMNLPILGVLRRQDAITIPDRYLGLVPTAELPELDALAERLADWAEQWFDWAQLLPLLKTNRAKTPASDSSTSALSPADKLEAQANGEFPWRSPAPEAHPGYSRLEGNDRSSLHPIIAVAYDRAFNFYYADNLDLLRQFGAELVFWSPLEEALPAPIHGLYLGGGFPELLAQPLSENRMARSAVKTAIESGLPTYAECGGLMYLAEHLVDFEERSWEMVGVLPTIAQMDQRLTLGYRRAVLLQNSPLLPAGAVVWGHEFHRSMLTKPSAAPLYRIQGYDPQSPFSSEGWRVHQVHASYVHVHWGANLTIPANFVRSCLEYGQCSQPSENHSDTP